MNTTQTLAPPTPRTWRLVRVDQLRAGDLVKLPNPPFARIISVSPRVVSGGQPDHSLSEWNVYTLQLDAHWWREASDLPEELHRYRAAGYQDGFVACRYGFEAIECWRENEGVPA